MTDERRYRCSSCAEKKPADDFHKSLRKRRPVQAYCKACVKAYAMLTKARRRIVETHGFESGDRKCVGVATRITPALWKAACATWTRPRMTPAKYLRQLIEQDVERFRTNH